MSKRDNLLLVDDIITSFRAIKLYTKNMSYEDFLNNQMCKDAVVRNFEIIGEAANYLSPEYKLTHDTIEWRKLTDFRNRLIHHYFGISYEIVWEVIEKEADDFLIFFESLVK